MIGDDQISQQPQGLDEPQTSPSALDDPAMVAPVPLPTDAPRDKEKEKKRKKKEDEPRGTETMFRVTYQNHVSLSRLADNKANMLIHINGLIISVLIALVAGIKVGGAAVVPRLASLSWMLVPVVFLVAGSVVSLVLAVLCAKPFFSRAPLTSERVRNGTGNVLFFGHFTTMSLEEFQESLRALMKDRRLLYEAMARQLYEMGHALNHKYRYLQFAYAAFLLGVVFAAVSFVLVLLGGRFGG